MTNPTNPFNWQMPTASDLVTDLPADFETFGQAVATSMADLLGGTTGQVLSKASNTDMDFTWVAQDDSNAIQNAIVDAKGDLIAASAADTPARLAVGNNGETLVADSSTATGLRYRGDYAAGKNKIINGDFGINQRSFTSTTTNQTYTFDRWQTRNSDGTVTYTAQTFSPGAAPVVGYEGSNFAQIDVTGQTLTDARALYFNRIEDVRTFAGQTVTLSFWAKATSGTPSINVFLSQGFGTGGSSSVDITATKQTISTSWVRYSWTINVPSISGKTIGTGSQLLVSICVSGGSAISAVNGLGIQTGTFQIWGVQLEAGSVATAFQTATGTIQGELAACQRYYYRQTPSSAYGWVAFGLASGATGGAVGTTFPVQMRVTPTSIEYSTLSASDAASTTALTSLTIDSNVSSSTVGVSNFGVASGLTAYRPYYLRQSASAAGYLAYSAEL